MSGVACAAHGNLCSSPVTLCVRCYILKQCRQKISKRRVGRAGLSAYP
ncbi:hypothetical protein EDWATA_01786 [Edwardsiella tarda ATCC 23685]|uniref:Uncharacterized protein n=1 Tax=Edwardsiella tarda ATCC 23685 TaxID=500638 RepID=D4F4V9_EDWTA|nr:hypothetical protein EDWATA_01786 [Edwardsiella tarda ATCC 23685]